MTTTTTDDLTDRVRARYAAAAAMAERGSRSSDAPCCTDAGSGDAITDNLYTADETEGLPEKAVLASLGCGNPIALIDLQGGETVLDLGSGGGIDVLLSAQRVGPTGFVYGVDMTDEMLALAQENKAKAGVANVAFLKGRIEDIPLPADSVDVVISNCVINLAADKSLVLQDAVRVLKPGGRFAVADVVTDDPVPDALRQNMEAWVGCIAGALDTTTYERLLHDAGFADIGIEVTRRYTVADTDLDPSTLPPGWEDFDGKIASAFMRAVKPASVPQLVSADTPASEPCCGPECCY
jgi:SAM-dependent methyltransferase